MQQTNTMHRLKQGSRKVDNMDSERLENLAEIFTQSERTQANSANGVVATTAFPLVSFFLLFKSLLSAQRQRAKSKKL